MTSALFVQDEKSRGMGIAIPPADMAWRLLVLWRYIATEGVKLKCGRIAK